MINPDINQIKLVDDSSLNEDVLNSNLEEIDIVSKSVKYDLQRNMSYFNIRVDKKENSADLFHKAQKYIYLLELYHLNMKSGLADFK